jgi:hypothetical protein
VTAALLERLIFWAGVGQLSILIASAMVPYRLQWRTALSSLPPLHRQMYWVYGGYVVMSIIAFALLSIANARELAGGSGLARGVCGYVAIFWGVRVLLQGVFDVKEHLTAWWLHAGYHSLTLLFATLTIVYAWAAIGGVTR